jgi:hypothetical protein
MRNRMQHPKLKKVIKMSISHPTRAQHSLSAAGTVHVSRRYYHSLLMLTVGPWDQFPRWRCWRRRLSECSVLRFPDHGLQCSLSFVHGFKNILFLCGGLFKSCMKLTLRRNSRETWTVTATDSVCRACVGGEIHLLSTSETAPFFYVRTVFLPAIIPKYTRAPKCK